MKASAKGIILAIAFLVSHSSAIEARETIGIETGGDLKALCEADRKSAEYAMCYAFNAAVLEVVTNNTIYGFKICVPPRVNVNKSVELPLKWLSDHPAGATEPASKVATEAYAAAFPCKN